MVGPGIGKIFMGASVWLDINLLQRVHPHQCLIELSSLLASLQLNRILGPYMRLQVPTLQEPSVGLTRLTRIG